MRGLAVAVVLLVVAAGGCFDKSPKASATLGTDVSEGSGDNPPQTTVAGKPGDVGGGSSGGAAGPDDFVMPGQPTILASVEGETVSVSFTWNLVATKVSWDFGDGHTDNATSASHAYVNAGNYTIRLNVSAGAAERAATTQVSITSVPWLPHVVVAVADSGINPYHDIYRRPDLVAHPCTYVQGYSCDVPALPLSIGLHDTWQEAFDADRLLWDGVQLGQWYWIPGTNIIGAACDAPEGGGATAALDEGAICILDDSNMHGTGTTSSVLMEAPDALLLFSESTSLAESMAFAPVAPDIQSHSWGPPAPLPLHPLFAATTPDNNCGFGQYHAQALFFQAAGNEALFPAPADFARFCPSAIVIGGATSTAGEVGSWTFYDFASWYCRPTAQTNSLHEYRASYCGTSFATPTAAGTAAAALLELRRQEGFTGGNTLEHVTPNVTREDFLHALRWSATYHPAATYSTGNGYAPIPLAPGSEYLVWGWGFLDKQVVPTIVACAQGTCPQKDATAVAWNEAREDLRRQAWDPV